MTTAFDVFYKVTGVSVSNYFADFNYFIENQHKYILSYYSGETTDFNAEAFNELKNLRLEYQNISRLTETYKNSLVGVEFWDIITTLSDIDSALESINNYPKWLRTSKNVGRYQGVGVDFIQKQNQTLESLAKDAGFRDPENEWVDIALDNSAMETDYTKEGGLSTTIFTKSDNSIFINSVVDVITGENVYGKDLDLTLTFEGNDLKTLGYRDTIEQAADTLLNLKQGSVPEFPNDGVDSSILSNVNTASVSTPMIIRQLYKTFSKDDTFGSVEILSINRVDDSVSIEVSLSTRLGEVISKNFTTN